MIPQIPHMEAKSHPKMRGKLCVTAAGCGPSACPAVFLHTNAAMRALGPRRLPTDTKRLERRKIHAPPAKSWWSCLPSQGLHDRECAGPMIQICECGRVEYGRCGRRCNSSHIREYCEWQPEISWGPRALRELASFRPLRAVPGESSDPRLSTARRLKLPLPRAWSSGASQPKAAGELACPRYPQD